MPKNGKVNLSYRFLFVMLSCERKLKNQDSSQLYALLLKISSVRQHCINDSHELMCCYKYCLLKWFALISFLKKVFSEYGIMIDYSNCHKPDHSPEMPIPSLGYLACSFIFV